MKQYNVKVFNDRTEWYNSDGLLDRDNGPAIEYAGGTKCWYRNNELHREDGPAVEYSNGTKAWYKNGIQHRDDGPAIEWHDGLKNFYLYGIHYSEEEYYNEINSCKNKLIEVDGKKYTLVPV